MGDDGLGGPALVPQRRRALHNARMSRRWTAEREALFFAELAATANVTHAAGQAGMSAASAHARRARHPGFAVQWLKALAVGYAELEMLLLRQAMQGSERTETVRDAEGAIKQTRTIHSFPHATAMRLLQGHRQSVERFRAMEVAAEDDDEAVARIRAELLRVRERLIVPALEDADAAGVTIEGSAEGVADA